MENEINIKKFAQRFKELVDENETDIETLQKVIGLKSKSTFYRYFNGKMTPKISTIKYLAEYYNVNASWLMGYDIEKYNTKYNIDELGNAVVTIPVIGSVKAGYDYLAQENWIDTIDLSKKVADTGDFFALKVRGDSMAPIFFEGDIVILKKQNDCENNEVAVVIVNGNEGTLKKVKKTDVGIILQSFNPAYTPVMYTNKEIIETPIIIAGVFQELRRTDIKF